MTFEEAYEEMKKLADSTPITKGYFVLQYAITDYGNGKLEAKCDVYMNGFNYEHGKTWREAIDKMKYAVTQPMPDLGEAPKEDDTLVSSSPA
jgi:hypothetical protein